MEVKENERKWQGVAMVEVRQDRTKKKKKKEREEVCISLDQSVPVPASQVRSGLAEPDNLQRKPQCASVLCGIFLHFQFESSVQGNIKMVPQEKNELH